LGIVVDSSFFVSLFLKTDENHKTAIKIFEEFATKHKELLSPTLFFPEVVGTIKRRTDDMHFAQIIEETLGKWVENLIGLKELTKERMLLSSEHAILYGLRGADAVFAALAAETKSELLTFDEEIRKKFKGKIKIFEIEE